MRKLVPIFSFTFDAPVWNIYEDIGGGLLVETRDAASEETRLFQIFKDFSTPIAAPLKLPWLSQVIYADSRHILVQEFNSAQNPSETLTHCYSKKGVKLWTMENLKVLDTNPEFYSFLNKNDQEIVIDPASGEVTTPKTISENSKGLLEFPAHYTETQGYFQDVAAFIRQELGVEPVRAIDYMEKEKKIIFSYYKSLGNFLALELIMLDSEGTSILFEVLGEDFQGIADPPFLFYQRNLIFVKERRHFFVYALPTEQ